MILQVFCKNGLFYGQFGEKEKIIAILSSKPSEETKMGKFDMHQSSHVFFSYSVSYLHF